MRKKNCHENYIIQISKYIQWSKSNRTVNKDCVTQKQQANHSVYYTRLFTNGGTSTARTVWGMEAEKAVGRREEENKKLLSLCREQKGAENFPSSSVSIMVRERKTKCGRER